MKNILFSIVLFCCIKISFGQTGQLDPTFGNNGIVKSDLSSVYNYDNSGRQVFLLPDGSMYFLFESNGICVVSKRHADGSIDNSYGENGYSSSLPIYGSKAALQPDGKLVVVGYSIHYEMYEYNDKDFAVARLNSNGTLDKTFDEDGITSTDFYYSDVATAVAIQPDGKIIVVGNVVDNSTDRGFIGLARYNSNGILDNSFNDNGIQKNNFSNYGESACGVALQSDNKIVITGSANNGLDYDFFVARFNTRGSLELSFGDNGRIYTDFGFADDYANAMTILADDKILVAGSAGEYFGICKYNKDGEPDSSFDEDGMRTTFFSGDFSVATSIAIQQNQRIILAGFTGDGVTNDFAVARFNTDGGLDHTFHNDGKLVTDFGSSDDYANSITIQTDGDIVVLGSSTKQNMPTSATAIRYFPNGNIDNTFGSAGIVTERIAQGYTSYTSTAVQTDGKIIAAGYAWNGSNFDFAIARYNPNGSFDNTFSADGKLLTDFGAANNKIRTLTIQTNGKILVAGFAGNNPALARYNTDGNLDNTFSGDGKQTTNLGSVDSINTIALQTDGKIVAGTSGWLLRYNANGSPDLTFDGDGRLAIPFACKDVVIQTNGKILITGDGFVARYNSNGSVDNTFADNGQKNLIDEFNPNYQEEFYLHTQSIILQPDGKIVIGGYYQHDYRGISSMYTIIRLNTDGSFDNTFDGDGIAFSSLFQDNYATSLTLQSDNKIILAGYTYNETSNDFTVLRYNANGSLDNTFGQNGIQQTQASSAYDQAESVAIYNDKLYAAGSGQYPGNLGVVVSYLLAAGGPTPVTLTDFKATLQNTIVLLQWQTSSEQNLSYFTIERSEDGNSFSSIGNVTAKGNSVIKLEYAFRDLHPMAGINFYRLKMVDIDSKFKYSKIVAVKINPPALSLHLFPNPATNILFITVNGQNEKATFQITDANGKKLKEIKTAINGNTSVSIPVNNLPGGVYYLQFISGEKRETRKFIKQ